MAGDLAGRTVVVTGASAGIGEAAATRFAALGARVVVVGRSPEKTKAVAAGIGAAPVVGDFARLADVRRVAAEVLELCPRIDVLANNAGALFEEREVTEDGFEMTFQVNHLAGFLLTGLLAERLAATPDSRVLTTGSMINRIGRIDLDDLNRSRRPYRSFPAYADSKLANVLFTRELARRAGPGGPTAVTFHPGFVNSHFARDNAFLSAMNGPWARYLIRTPEGGSAPMVALGTRADPRAVHGAYLHRQWRQDRVFTNRQARDPALAAALWDRCSEMVGLP